MTADAAQRTRSTPSLDVSEWKLHPPVARRGIVDRVSLLETVSDAAAGSVISIVAPPGYGKTTLLAQLAGRKRRVGWVSLDDRDNDPIALLTYLVMAVDRIEPIDPSVAQALVSMGGPLIVVRRLVGAIAAMSRPITLVADNFEAITNRECLDAVAEIAMGLPSGCQLVIASRHDLPLPVARLRAAGSIVEIGVEDLAMGEEEACSLLAHAGVDVADGEVTELLDRTEGWAVGLYLAALTRTAGRAHTDSWSAFSGDDRFMSDYLRFELLDRLSTEHQTFLTRTSILDRMCGPLCDAVLAGRQSSLVLEGLESQNMLVIPLDRRREWYRYHHLFRELLESELRRRDPELISQLHLRAATWCEANGMLETAIEHAQVAGDADRVARLVLKMANPAWASGRADTVLRWMQWFEANELVEKYPGIAVHGALMFALVGRSSDTERWTLAAERTTLTGTLPDGNSVDGSLAYLRTLLCRDGVETMRHDAQVAWNGLSAGSPYRAAMLHAEGVGYLLEGDLERADAMFARAVDSAARAGLLPFIPVILAERGIVVGQRQDWPAVDEYVAQVLSMMQAGRFDDYWTSALVYAWAARAVLRRGDVGRGRQLVARAARLRPLLSYALPVVSVQALLEMARAYIALGDPGGARAVLRQVRDILQQRPDLGVLPAEAEVLRAHLETMGTRALGMSSLTTAELRLLPLLSTHLTLREIGERLYLSRNTVKTQAISVYRKLGVTSRSETIARVHELGLLDQV